MALQPFIPLIQPDSLSAADVFGAASELAHRSGAAHAVAAGAGDAVLQVAALAVTLLYVYMLVRYFDVVRVIVASVVGGAPSERRRRRVFNSVMLRNVEIVIAVAGFVAAAAVAARLAVTKMAESAFSANVSVLACTVAAGLAALAVFEYSAVRAAGFVSGRTDVCLSVLQLKLRHFSAAAATMLPVGILALFSAPTVACACFYVMAVQCAISAILFAKETFSLFISQRVSILYWILYLCTLELFPASLLLAPIMRAGAGY